MSHQELETAKLLARFKLKVRRTLDRSVDLDALGRDPAYAIQTLKEIEDLAEDEDLLVMVIQLRSLLGPRSGEASSVSTPAPAASGETRNYRFGARAW